MDPVCEMKIDEHRTEFVSVFEGRTFAFCSAECKEEFDQDPRRYMGSLHELNFERPTHGEGGTPPSERQIPGAYPH
jgi:YHS domain-containing protein